MRTNANFANQIESIIMETLETTKDRLNDLVQRTAIRVNDDMALPETIAISGDTTDILYGSGARIDSLTLVNFIVAVEDGIHDEFGVSAILADDRAMSMEHSPFATLDSLVNYAAIVIRESAQTVSNE